MKKFALALVALSAAACSSGPPPYVEPSRTMPRFTPAWKELATPADRERLRDWRRTFVDALASARRAGHGAEIDREGALLDPDAALPDPVIPTGTYRCRVTKVGAQPGLLDYIAYPAFRCVVGTDGALHRLDKVTGSQRYVGLIFPNDALRQVFLGTIVLGDETRAMQYGQDEMRNVAGYIERIGDRRWRLVMPKPHYESLTDVMELVPA